MNSVGILGAGSWGWALAHLITKNKHKAVIWTNDKDAAESINKNGINPKRFYEFPLTGSYEATTELKDVFSKCELILIALPTKAIREVIKKSSKYIEGNHIIINTSKGIEITTGKRITEIIKEESCCKKIGVLSGPNLAKEILEGYPAAAVIASNIKEVQEKAYSILHSGFFRIYLSYDIIGVELGGALKNIYAIASGIADAMGFKINSIAFLLARSVSEMVRFGEKFGAKKETFFGLSGVGDLFATALSDLSRNKRFGKLIAQGKKPEEALKEIGETVEGYFTTKIAYELAQKMGIKMNILHTIYKILFLNYELPLALRELLASEIKEEF